MVPVAPSLQTPAGVPLYPGDSSNQGPPAGHLTLPMVSLSAADDQALFELNVRVQYSDDERLLLPALLELSGALGVDLPAEALLLRPSVLVSTYDGCGCVHLEDTSCLCLFGGRVGGCQHFWSCRGLWGWTCQLKHCCCGPEYC